MKLLICTQKVDLNDDVLGFFHSWIHEFSKHCEKITVICLYKGEFDLPDNVEVMSLGKEDKSKFLISKFQFLSRIQYSFRLLIKAWSKRKDYDTVFVHMNSEYIVVAGWIWKILNKPVSLSYIHKAIPWQLRIAEKFVKNIFTASRESCNLKSDKIKVIGHGIDVNKFRMTNDPSVPLGAGEVRMNSKFKIIYVGRVSRIKNHRLLISSVDVLVNEQGLENLEVDIIGSPHYPSDKKYLDELKQFVKEKNLSDVIKFVGSIPNKDMPAVYEQADLSVNLCPTGGVDKAVLESMACGTPVIALNQAFSDIMGEFKNEMIINKESAKDLAEKISELFNKDKVWQEEAGRGLRNKVVVNYCLNSYIERMVGYI